MRIQIQVERKTLMISVLHHRMHRLIQLMMEWTNHLEHKEYVSSLVYLRFNPPIASIGVLWESKIMWGTNRSHP